MRFFLPTLLATSLLTRATTTLPQTEEQEWQAADGALRGRVESVSCFASKGTGRPVTRAVIAVEETLRGRLPARLEVTYPGGAVGGGGEDSGDYPALHPGDERLFFVSRKGKTLTLTSGSLSAKKLAYRADGSLAFDEVLRQRRFKRMQEAEAAPADLTPFVAPAPAAGAHVAEENGAGGTGDKSGLSLGTNGNNPLPARWVAPDRGEPIPYIVDTTVLPPGITRTQALTAVSNAFAAWSAATGMTFTFEGEQDFGTGADFVLNSDEKIRIQLHDTYGSISSASAIGIGGRAWSSTDTLLDNVGGGGGQVAGLEFHKAVRGYVVLRQTAPQFSNVKTLEEVLCHELGHVFGLTHSSELAAEPSTLLSEAAMYYKAHADNRGARLGAYDVPVIQKVHPLTNTPPWAYPRYMTAHTGSYPNLQTTPGVNEFTLTGYDKQPGAPALTMVAGPATGLSQGTFSFSGGKVIFAPAGNWSNGGVGDPTTSYYAKVLYRYSDGVNCSPWQPVSVIAYRMDTSPVGSGAFGDGLPDNWMIQHFGSAIPSANNKSRPGDDPDGDGLTNLEEYRLGTVPVNYYSRFDYNTVSSDKLEWLARPWALYALESSTDGSTWQFWKARVATAGPGATITQGSISITPDPSVTRRFLRMKQMQ